ncbi:MAG: cysteine hydrolase family protein [Acidimicrobiales bacterium]
MNVDNSTTALLVMDLQHDIVSIDGALGSHGLGFEVEKAGTIEACSRALEAARRSGTPVVHVGVAIPDGFAVNTASQLMQTVVAAGALREGSAGAEFMAQVAPRDAELVVMKQTVSAFAGTSLALHLHNAGIRHLVLCGVATNFVVEGTARQAVDGGFQVTILTDGCSSFSTEWHEAALEVLAMLTSFASVDEFVAAVPS